MDLSTTSWLLLCTVCSYHLLPDSIFNCIVQRFDLHFRSMRYIKINVIIINYTTATSYFLTPTSINLVKVLPFSGKISKRIFSKLLFHHSCQPLKLTMTTVCPWLLNMINDFVLLRFWARVPEDLSAIEVILYYTRLTDSPPLPGIPGIPSSPGLPEAPRSPPYPFSPISPGRPSLAGLPFSPLLPGTQCRHEPPDIPEDRSVRGQHSH